MASRAESRELHQVLAALDVHASSIFDIAMQLEAVARPPPPPTVLAVHHSPVPIVAQTPPRRACTSSSDFTPPAVPEQALRRARTVLPDECGKRRECPKPCRDAQKSEREVPVADAQPAVEEKDRGPISSRIGPERTVICIDWDDAIFPTSWVVDSMHLADKEDPLEDPDVGLPLRRCAAAGAAILKELASLADRVVVVAPMPRARLFEAADRFLPGLRWQLDNLNIRVVCAIPAGMCDKKEAKPWRRLSDDEWALARARVIARECEDFYAKYAERTWKNVLIIGSTDFELNRSQTKAEKWTWEHRRFALQLPGLKTLRLFTCPTCRELASELIALRSVVEDVVHRTPWSEGPMGIDFKELRAIFSDNAVRAMVHETTLGYVGDQASGEAKRTFIDGAPQVGAWLDQKANLLY